MKSNVKFLCSIIVIIFIFVSATVQLDAKNGFNSKVIVFSDTIPESTFILWTNTWNTQGRTYVANNLLRAFNLPIAAIRNVLMQSPASIRLYFGLDISGGNTTPHLILVGFDAAGNKTGSYFNASTPCPPTCENVDLTPDDKETGGDKNPNTISISTFIAWNMGWSMSGQAYMQENLALYFNMPLVNLTNLNNQNTAGVRFYLGLDTSVTPNVAHLNMVGVDQNGKDILTQIYNESAPCPPDCGVR